MPLVDPARAVKVSLTNRASAGTGSVTTCTPPSGGSGAAAAFTNPVVGDFVDSEISTAPGRARLRSTS